VSKKTQAFAAPWLSRFMAWNGWSSNPFEGAARMGGFQCVFHCSSLQIGDPMTWKLVEIIGRPTKISNGASYSHRARSSAGGNHFLFGKLRDATTKRCEASTQRLPFWAHRVPVSGCALQRSCWPFRSRLDVTAVYVPWARSIQRLRSTTK
jgi:hypothetical protein